jgi:peptidoglycan/LPS O-acetylase OafA/YrhL
LVFSDKGWLAQSKLLQNIGVRSYGLFLSHIGVFWYASIPILDKMNVQDCILRFCIGGLIAIVVSYILSDVSFQFFENQRLGTKKKATF